VPDVIDVPSDGLPRVVEELEGEAAARRLGGWTGWLASLLSLGLSIYALYWVVGIVQPQIYRVSFLLLALVLTFLIYPARRAARGRVTAVDWMLASLSVVALTWPIIDFDRFVYRAATPTTIDLALGALAIVLVLEATRRTVGWILPATAMAFLAYAYYGPLLDLVGLSLVAHRGYPPDRLIGTLYMTLEGIFGVPLDVAATYIVLFTIYGSVLEHSGAGRFFVDWARAAIGRSGGGAGPGRAVAVAGYLLGCVSGSGVANTVMLGAVSWPMMRQARYGPDVAGAIMASAGIGAILAPPVMGAAAFLIAEFLHISYLDVVVMAIVPAFLYYLSIFLMIEADSRRLGTRAVEQEAVSLWDLTRRSGYHFTSLLAIVVLMARGMTAFRAVLWATTLAVALSFLDRTTALWPRRLVTALASGGRSILSVAATTATAGIIVGVVTLTGLGLKVAGLIVTLAGESLLLTVLYAAVAVWVLGLAVPVTASYIIAAVMIAPALTAVGIPDVAAHMFIFYYAVLSEVSPPTALSPFAAAALTGGNPFRTTMLTWKYTAPAFLVPFVFTLSRDGLGVLMQAPVLTVIWVSGTAGLGIAAFAAGAGGWIRAEANLIERVLAIAGGTLLFYPGVRTDLSGVAIVATAIGIHLMRIRRFR
jgi:TRAP transporter 4TM/12TM fusion protein